MDNTIATILISTIIISSIVYTLLLIYLSHTIDDNFNQLKKIKKNKKKKAQARNNKK